MNILIFLIILAVLVLVHECGHFLVAKKSGIRVDEFGLGFPPRVFGKKIGETIYSLNAIPFGGFVKIFGENPNDEIESGNADDQNRSMASKNRMIQATVLSAGISFNILFAWLVISVGFMFGLPTAVDSPNTVGITDAHVIVSSVMPKSPAEMAGLKVGDTLLSIKDGLSDVGQNITPDTIRDFIMKSSEPLVISYRRGALDFQTTVLAKEGIVSSGKAVGISMDMVGILKLPVHLAFWEGGVRTLDLFKTVAVNIFYFLRDAVLGRADLSQVSGPVGMVALVGDARDLGFSYLIFFTAILSINLAVINLIPFPALDGGRLFVLLIEAVKRSPIKPKLANGLNAIGFALLIILMLVVSYHDILRLF